MYKWDTTITCPHRRCVARYTSQLITLTNPTEETLRLIPLLSNTNNFRLERDNEQALELRPHCTIKVPLTFMPSGLGTADHACKISFMCEQVRASLRACVSSRCQLITCSYRNIPRNIMPFPVFYLYVAIILFNVCEHYRDCTALLTPVWR